MKNEAIDTRETIGRCEGFCGLVDHHLIDGICPSCRKVITTIDSKDNGYTVGKEHSQRLSEVNDVVDTSN